MNELALLEENAEQFPTIYEGLKRAQSIFDRIQSWSDIKKLFFDGSGLSVNTYRNYIADVKNFYEYTEHKNPLQVTAGDIESWFDWMMKRCDRKTCVRRISGLKRFFKNVAEKVPLYTSPFELMNKKLKKKVTKLPRGNRVPISLTKDETNKLLDRLREDKSNAGVRLYSICFMLVTSGLRINELLGLSWGDIYKRDETYYCSFIGKGDKDAEQELQTDAVDSVLDYHLKVYEEKPRNIDFLYYALTTGEVLKANTAWCLVNNLWEKLQREDFFGREIKLHPHLFRRTYATLLYKAGMQLIDVARKTRHASIDCLVKHYIGSSEPSKAFWDKILV